MACAPLRAFPQLHSAKLRPNTSTSRQPPLHCLTAVCNCTGSNSRLVFTSRSLFMKSYICNYLTSWSNTHTRAVFLLKQLLQKYVKDYLWLFAYRYYMQTNKLLSVRVTTVINVNMRANIWFYRCKLPYYFV